MKRKATLHDAAIAVLDAMAGNDSSPVPVSVRNAVAGLRVALERDREKKSESGRVTGPTPRGRPRKVDRAAVIELLGTGLSAAEIARRVGCSPSAVACIRKTIVVEHHLLQSERTTVVKLLSAIPEEDVLDRVSLEARLVVIERQEEEEVA